MKLPFPAVLYGTGLLLAFGAGWFFKAAAFPEDAAPVSMPAIPVKPSSPLAQKPGSTLPNPIGQGLEAALADVAAVRAAMRPGVVNQVLLSRLKDVIALQDENARSTRWRALMETMRSEDVSAVRKLWWHEFSQGRRWDGMETPVYHQWGRLDGLRAAELTEKEGLGKDALNAVLAGWACVESEAALAWVKHNSGKVESPAAVKAMVNAMAAESPAAALQFIRAHAGKSEFAGVLRMEMDFAIRQKGLTAAAAAFDEIARSSLPDDYKTANLRTLSDYYRKAYLGGSPGSAINKDLMQLTQRHLGETWFPADEAIRMGYILAIQAPESGVETLAQFTNAKSREIFAETLFDEWGRKKPESLSQWLTENKGHAEFDRAAFRLVVHLSQSNPEAAQAWAGEIRNPGYRKYLPGLLNPPPPAASEK